MNAFPPFNTVYVIIVDGYRVPETAGFDLNGNALIFKANLQHWVFVRLTVPVIPNDIGGIVQFVRLSQTEFRKAVVYENVADGGL